MTKLEQKWTSCALEATAEDDRPLVSPVDVLAALVAQCGVTRRYVKVDVHTPPAEHVHMRSTFEKLVVMNTMVKADFDFDNLHDEYVGKG